MNSCSALWILVWWRWGVDNEKEVLSTRYYLIRYLIFCLRIFAAVDIFYLLYVLLLSTLELDMYRHCGRWKCQCARWKFFVQSVFYFGLLVGLSTRPWIGWGVFIGRFGPHKKWCDGKKCWLVDLVEVTLPSFCYNSRTLLHYNIIILLLWCCIYYLQQLRNHEKWWY